MADRDDVVGPVDVGHGLAQAVPKQHKDTPGAGCRAALHLGQEHVGADLVEGVGKLHRAGIVLVEGLAVVVDENSRGGRIVDAAVLPREESEPIDGVDGQVLARLGVAPLQGVLDNALLVAGIAHRKGTDHGVIIGRTLASSDDEEVAQLIRRPHAGIGADLINDSVGCGGSVQHA